MAVCRRAPSSVADIPEISADIQPSQTPNQSDLCENEGLSQPGHANWTSRYIK